MEGSPKKESKEQSVKVFELKTLKALNAQLAASA